MINVAPGQVWKSADTRETRHVLIQSVDRSFAYVVGCGPDGRIHGRTRQSRILIDYAGRLARYRLVRDAEDQP